MFINTSFILASNSKSRFLILKNNKLNFRQTSPKCNEKEIKKKLIKRKTPPIKISLMLAKAKAKSINTNNKNYLVVGSDTVIELNKKIIHKAKNLKEAKKTLIKISGKKHVIYSSAVVYYKNKLVWKKTQKTNVKIRKISKKEIGIYLSHVGKNILKSAGCYQIEKDGPNIIENINGDFFNVMGFPLFPFLVFLKKFNIKK